LYDQVAHTYGDEGGDEASRLELIILQNY